MPSIRVLVAIVCVLSASLAAAEYREIEIANAAKIVGQVRVAGALPVLPPQPVFKEQQVCGAELADERLIIGEQGAVRNVLVYLTDIKAGKAVHLADPVKLDNQKCAFVPHVLDATAGQTLEIHNSDPFLHDAHGILGIRTLFNVAVMKNRTVSVPLVDVGLIHLNCNVRHTWMHGYLYVAEHPYHTVTGADGRFVIDGVPPGAWTLRVWHELLGSNDRQVRLEAGEVNTQEISLHPTAPE